MNVLHRVGGHPADGEWRAFLDGEVEVDRRDLLAAHLGHCRYCQRAVATMEAEARFAAAKLRGLQSAVATAHGPLPQAGKPQPRPRSRWITVAAAALLCLLLPLTLSPGLRAGATELFRRFRPQQIQVVHMSETDRAKLQQVPTGVVLQLAQALFPSAEAQGEAEPPDELVTVEELASKGFTAPTYVPKGYGVPWSGWYTPGWDISHSLSVAEVNRLLEEVDLDYRLPDGLMTGELRFGIGERFTYLLHPEGEGEPVVVMQEGPRTLYAPEAVALEQILGDLMVRLATDQGASPEVVGQFRQAQVLQTVQLPIAGPQDSEVEVDGAVGAFIQRPGRNELVWMKDGTTWRVFGPLQREEMLKIARSMAP